MNKKLYKVNFYYYQNQFSNNFKFPCFNKDFGDFFFNWSLRTIKLLGNQLLSKNPSKYFISSVNEIESISNKKEVFEKILASYSKTKSNKIDIFEFLSFIPFIVSDNFKLALESALNFFCIENSNVDNGGTSNIITKIELSLFFDSYFRSLHNVLLNEKQDDIFKKTQNNIIKLSENEVDSIVNSILELTEEELEVEKVVE